MSTSIYVFTAFRREHILSPLSCTTDSEFAARSSGSVGTGGLPLCSSPPLLGTNGSGSACVWPCRRVRLSGAEFVVTPRQQQARSGERRCQATDERLQRCCGQRRRRDGLCPETPVCVSVDSSPPCVDVRRDTGHCVLLAALRRERRDALTAVYLRGKRA